MEHDFEFVDRDPALEAAVDPARGFEELKEDAAIEEEVAASGTAVTLHAPQLQVISEYVETAKVDPTTDLKGDRRFHELGVTNAPASLKISLFLNNAEMILFDGYDFMFDSVLESTENLSFSSEEDEEEDSE